jgi:2-polyprenyl-6-hydroxyphenyl methylase/3-demethylubiquinone-9 3-methyltransferase
MPIIKSFIDANVRVSQAIDRLLPTAARADGNKTFIAEYLPRAMREGHTIYDLGGGSRPCVDLETKRRLHMKVIGVDVSADELAAAPAGVYDEEIAADLCTFIGPANADGVVCQALLEHVPDGAGAIRAIATTLKPGARAYIFAPSRNAIFARLNLLLPQKLKQRLLFLLFPHKAEGHDGFLAYYNRCTPRDVEKLAAANGLLVEERRLFWISSYFAVFAPAYLAWRIIQGGIYLLLRENAAETYIYVLRKPIPDQAAQ